MNGNVPSHPHLYIQGLILSVHSNADVLIKIYGPHCTAAVKCLHPNICIAVHCSIPLHPQLSWYHESAYHWGSRDQV